MTKLTPQQSLERDRKRAQKELQVQHLPAADPPVRDPDRLVEESELRSAAVARDHSIIEAQSTKFSHEVRNSRHYTIWRTHIVAMLRVCDRLIASTTVEITPQVEDNDLGQSPSGTIPESSPAANSHLEIETA